MLWFSLGFTVAPPAFGWLLDRTDAYGPGFAILIGLYVAAAVIMLVSRGPFARSSPQRA